ncbi:unnamed protein product [Citrullus colocynthis]|uniref:Fe2OG dioxygenase domain-containing protein n=1 Tax=Citrullus colocynthis TaxID=252529 RepID=A0ABP0Y5Y5_9ROSI
MREAPTRSSTLRPWDCRREGFELALGIGRHKDSSVLTVLAQDEVGGLEVKRKKDGEWVPIKQPIPDSYVVNVGHITQVWSNEKYESVKHRAVMVNSKKERYSFAFFFNPSHSTIVEPLEELIDPQNPPKYKSYSFGKFLTHRKRSNFKKLNVDNIQVNNFPPINQNHQSNGEEQEQDQEQVPVTTNSGVSLLPTVQYFSAALSQTICVHPRILPWRLVLVQILPLLESSGHHVTALDLPTSGIDLRQPDTIRSISQYFQPLTEFMSALPRHQKVILVGHSLGGLAVAKAMEEFPARISAAVFVTALMPGPTLNISMIYGKVFERNESMMDSVYSYGDGPNRPPTAFVFGPRFSASKVYQLSPPEDLTLATLLMRPVPLFSEKDMSNELKLSEENYGSVKRVFVMSEKDLNPPDRVVKIEGSDHMVMISKPLELWAHLELIAQYYH